MKTVRRLLCLTLVVLLCATVFLACNGAKAKLKKVAKIERVGNYKIVSSKGISCDGKNYEFVSELEKQIKKDGNKVKNTQGHLDSYKLNGEKLYFIFQYYGRKGIVDSTYNFVYGYFNCREMKLYILNYWKNVDAFARIEIKAINEQYGLLCHSEQFQLNSEKLSLYDNEAKVFVDTDEKSEIIEQLLETTETPEIHYVFSGKEYEIEGEDTGNFIIKEKGSEDSKVLSPELVKEKSEEFGQVIEIFARGNDFEWDFKISLLYQNNELYVVLVDGDSFFGMYAGNPPR